MTAREALHSLQRHPKRASGRLRYRLQRHYLGNDQLIVIKIGISVAMRLLAPSPHWMRTQLSYMPYHPQT